MTTIALPTLPPSPLETAPSPEEIEALSAEVRALAVARDAVILAHNYQRPEVHAVADYVGDSLGLSPVSYTHLTLPTTPYV